MNPLRRIFGRRRSPEFESVARGQRARDHLARKRERERQRLERARREQEIRESRRRVFTVLAPILFLAAAALGFVAARPASEALLLRETPLERVAIQGARSLSPQAVAVGAGVLAGVPLRSVDPESVRQSLAGEPWVESARALRLPTGTLLVRVVERDAVARWRLAETTPTELVDGRGGRFAGALELGGPLPLVRGEGDRTGVLPEEALAILREVRRHPSLAARPAALTLYLPSSSAPDDPAQPEGLAGYVLQLGHDGPRVVLGRRMLPQRVARLAALLEEDRAMVRAARSIDFRYADRAVLQTEPTPG